MSNLNNFYEKLKAKNEKNKPFIELIKYSEKIYDDNVKLKKQLETCYNFILNNYFECRFDSNLPIIQNNNLKILNEITYNQHLLDDKLYLINNS